MRWPCMPGRDAMWYTYSCYAFQIAGRVSAHGLPIREHRVPDPADKQRFLEQYRMEAVRWLFDEFYARSLLYSGLQTTAIQVAALLRRAAFTVGNALS